MVQRVILASDLQNQGIEGNRHNLERIVQKANADKKVVGFSFAGDFGDIHIFQEPQMHQAAVNHAERYMQQSGFDVEQFKADSEKTQKKYPTVKDLQKAEKENKLSSEDEEFLKKNELYAMNIERFTEYAKADLMGSIYQEQAAIMGTLRKDVKIVGVLGNNDIAAAEKILTGVDFLGNKKEVTEIGKGITFMGANYTNFQGEQAWTPEVAGILPDDSPDKAKSQIYNRFKAIKKTPKIIVLHDSPKWTGANRLDQTLEGKSVVGLKTAIDEQEDDGELCLIHSGHSAKNFSGNVRPYLYKNLKGKLFLNINTDNIGGKVQPYAEVDFDDEGRFYGATIYSRAA